LKHNKASIGELALESEALCRRRFGRLGGE